MANNAKIELNGNLGNDAKIIEKEGKTFVALRIATTNSYPKKEGDKTIWEDSKVTLWHDILIFNPYALSIAKELKKGNRVEVTGTLSYRSFKDENGYTKQEASIIAYSIRKIEFNNETLIAVSYTHLTLPTTPYV